MDLFVSVALLASLTWRLKLFGPREQPVLEDFMASNTASVKHGFIFIQLVGLAVFSAASVFFGLSGPWHTLLLLAVALSMSGLVVAQYMGLKGEGALVYWTFFIPVILFAVLVAPLIPDIGHILVPFLRGR
jgi:cytochrome c oxidase subunit IV